MTADAIIFDFDGVILESVEIKTRAFVELFAEFPEHSDAITSLHRENGGMSRFEKFRIIHSDFLHRRLTDNEMNGLDRQFREIVAREIGICPFVTGSKDFLSARAAECPCYVASGTPEDELRQIVQMRGLAGYFRGVFGSPASKGSLVKRILADSGARPPRVVLVGDGQQDADAAAEHDLLFVGRRSADFAMVLPARTAALVDDLTELAIVWPSVVAMLSTA